MYLFLLVFTYELILLVGAVAFAFLSLFVIIFVGWLVDKIKGRMKREKQVVD